MAIFLLILGGLITFNFLLLKFSIQSVDNGDKKKSKKTVSIQNQKTKKTKIAKAA